METSHLDALELRLSNERIRLAQARSHHERELRSAWIRQIEKEIADERGFIGQAEPASDIDLLKALGA